MKKNRTVVRSCCACRAKGDKYQFLRVVRTLDGKAVTDPQHRISGRGIHFCRDVRCIEKASRMKAIERSFKWNADVPADIYERLKEECRINGQTE